MYYHFKASFCFTFIGLFGMSETVMKDTDQVEATCQKNKHFIQEEHDDEINFLKQAQNSNQEGAPGYLDVIQTYSNCLTGWEPRYRSRKEIQPRN